MKAKLNRMCSIVPISLLYYFYVTVFRKQSTIDNYKNTKYVLEWIWPMEWLNNNDCPQCYLISNKSYLDDITKYHAIIFHYPYIDKRSVFPRKRSPDQIYVFASQESPFNYPMCGETLNGFFNWTWTYRLDSDVLFPYIIIKDKKDNIIGPKQIMHWKKTEEMKPIDDDLKAKLKTKNKAAAWFASRCWNWYHRTKIATDLRRALKKYNSTLDIYGKCGSLECPRETMDDCLKMVEREYFFYLSFENSKDEDYVTEKLLHSVQHYAIPVVYGGANYTRFLPDGTYLDAVKLNVKELAKHMVDIISDQERYYSFFKWHNYYSYHAPQETPKTNKFCHLCTKLSEKETLRKTHMDLKKWWFPGKCNKDKSKTKL